MTGNPDIQYFAVSGTWVKPAGAARVDIVLQGGRAAAVAGALLPTVGPPGGFTAAHLGTRLSPNGYVVSNGEPGEIRVNSFDAADLPGTVEVEVGKGGSPGGLDGYALIVTHLNGEPEGGVSPMVARPLGRAVESAADAAIAIRPGDISEARGLLREAEYELDLAERRSEAGR